MNILFNKTGVNASSEFKALMGFIDVDIKFQNIKSDVLSATREVVDVVGRDIYNIAFNAYQSGNAEKESLIYHFQLPIAINAYRMYAPNNDIAHTGNGRKMRKTDNETVPFEWMIDRDNEALERKYYRALDELIRFLEETEPDWLQSEAYKKLQQSIFKTTDAFDEFFVIDSRLLLIKLQPGIRQCLQNDIKPRIGAEKLQLLLAENISPDLEELAFVVKAACAYYALSWAMPRLSVNLFPKGIIQGYVAEQQTTQAKSVADGNSLAFAKQYFENDYRQYLARIEEIIKKSLPADESDDDFLEDFITGKNFIST